MNLQQIVSNDLLTIEQDLGNQVFTWKTEDYACSPGSPTDLLQLQSGGFAQDADIVLVVRTNVFTDNILPKSQEKLTYRNKSYRILTVTKPAAGGMLRLICAEDSRGL